METKDKTTGLKDIHGVEIFENDILRYVELDSGLAFFNPVISVDGVLSFVVEYDEGHSYTVPVSTIHMDDNRGYEQILEVIGNLRSDSPLNKNFKELLKPFSPERV